jgi:thiamine biosynthesis protein ThiS
MKVYYNNQAVDVHDSTTLYELIETQEVIEHKAVWVNGNHVPLETFKSYVLSANDSVKVVRIRGGG